MYTPDCADSNCISKPGLIGWGEDLPLQSSLSQLSSSECITHISGGVSHSAVVCASGRVYTLGRNNYHGWMKKDKVNKPTLVRDLISYKINHATCGEDCTFFVTNEGLLFSSGRNVYGRLGLGNSRDTPTPSLIPGIPPVQKVAAGHEHTVILAECGEVWVCGANDGGQLGLGHFHKKYKFIIVPNLTDLIIDISCGSSFTALLTASGNIMMAGWNYYYQLGLSDPKKSFKFRSVYLPFTTIAAVACGSCHTAVLAVDGSVWVWGRNHNGELGVDTTVKNCLPLRLEGLERYTISSVLAGYQHTTLVTQWKDVLVCGRGESGELGHGSADISTPTLLKKSPGLRVKQMVFGEKYSLLNVTKELRASVSVLNQGTEGQQNDRQVKSCITVGLQTDSQRSCVTVGQQTDSQRSCVTVGQQTDSQKNCVTIGQQTNSMRSCVTVGQQTDIRRSCVTVGQQTDIRRSCVTVGQQTDCEAGNCVTDLERTIMEALECPVCCNMMSGPIHLCCNGHNLCGGCYSSQKVRVCPTCRGDFISARTTSLENISSQVKLPCVLCLRRMPVAALDSHDEVCPRRPYSCPLSCNWNGCLESMVDHLCTNHTEKEWKHVPHTFALNLEDNTLHMDLLEKAGEIFVLFTECTAKYCCFAVKYVGEPETATKFKFMLDLNIEGDETCVTFSKKVCSLHVKRKHALKPPYSVMQPLQNFDTPHIKVLNCEVNILLKA